MIEWNPVPHMKHAWSRANTVYGKAGLFVFYALIWFNIASALWTLINPYGQGMDCIINSFKGAASQAMCVSSLRGMAIFMIGFFLYADVGGLQPKNVAMVTIVLVSATYIWMNSAKDLGCDTFRSISIAMMAWPVVALVLAYLDATLGGSSTAGSANERTPLTA